MGLTGQRSSRKSVYQSCPQQLADMKPSSVSSVSRPTANSGPAGHLGLVRCWRPQDACCVDAMRRSVLLFRDEACHGYGVGQVWSSGFANKCNHPLDDMSTCWLPGFSRCADASAAPATTYSSAQRPLPMPEQRRFPRAPITRRAPVVASDHFDVEVKELPVVVQRRPLGARLRQVGPDGRLRM